jgi:hypothetical protein
VRKIILLGSAKTVGTDFAEAALFEEGTPDDVLDRACWESSIQNAEMYGYEYVEEYDESDPDFYENQILDDELNYEWEEYDPKKHDMLRAGGGSFEGDFERLMK